MIADINLPAAQLQVSLMVILDLNKFRLSWKSAFKGPLIFFSLSHNHQDFFYGSYLFARIILRSVLISRTLGTGHKESTTPGWTGNFDFEKKYILTKKFRTPFNC